MFFRLYKEGQGTWARGTLAGVIGLTGIMACMRLYERLQEAEWAQSALITVPFFNWGVKGDVIVAGLLIIPFGLVGIWLYNHKKLADFMIETETELKTKVTWPTRREAINNSIVVMITTILMGLWVFLADIVFQFLSRRVYEL
ncbi:MAG: preprotein translocase subunit SecE [Planctomycetota bacterium]